MDRYDKALWIVFIQKTKGSFSLKNEVIYHKKSNALEPDILLNSKDNTFKVVIDAKYKPRYE